MSKLTKAHIDTLRDLNGQAYAVLSESEAKPLIDGGQVRRVTIDPAPEKGHVAVSITQIGRGALVDTKSEPAAQDAA